MNFRYHPVRLTLPASKPLRSPRLCAHPSRRFRTSPNFSLNPCIIRTCNNTSRKPFTIRTYAPPSDLRILKDLPFSNLSRKPFRICTYKPPRKCGKQTTYNPFTIRTYKNFSRNSFRIRTYKNPAGSISLGTPISADRPTPSLLPLSPVRRSPLFQSVPTSACCQLSALDCQLPANSFRFTSFADPSFYPLCFHIFSKNMGEGVLRGFSRFTDHGPRVTHYPLCTIHFALLLLPFFSNPLPAPARRASIRPSGRRIPPSCTEGTHDLF